MAQRWGFGGIEVVNLFAFRSTKPRDLWTADDPIGPHNDLHIKRAAAHCQACVLAWGNLPIGRLDRARSVLKLLAGKKLLCLGMTKQQQPRHPLYLLSETDLEPFCNIEQKLAVNRAQAQAQATI